MPTTQRLRSSLSPLQLSYDAWWLTNELHRQQVVVEESIQMSSPKVNDSKAARDMYRSLAKKYVQVCSEDLRGRWYVQSDGRRSIRRLSV